MIWSDDSTRRWEDEKIGEKDYISVIPQTLQEKMMTMKWMK